MPRRAINDDDRARGARIRQAWKGAGLTRKQLAETIGRYYHDVLRLEGGQNPDPETIVKIADATGVPDRWLLRGPVYDPHFVEWLQTEAPADLHDLEREVLGAIQFPAEHHPGKSWYMAALGTWRAGTHNSLTSGTHVRKQLTAVGQSNTSASVVGIHRPSKARAIRHSDSEKPKK